MKKTLFCLMLSLVAGCGGGLPLESSQGGGDKNIDNYIAAYGDGWMLDVTWEDGSLLRQVHWTNKKVQSSGVFDVALRERHRPFEYSYPGCTSFYYGPYQPALEYHRGGVRVDVTMSHERNEFPSEEDMLTKLNSAWYSDPERVAVSSNGVLVALDVSAASPRHICVNISIYYLTVNGASPEQHVLKPFLKGDIFEGKRNKEKTQRTSSRGIKLKSNID